MPAKPALRVVKADAKPRPRRKLTVAQAAESGDRRALLVAMRDRIARTVADPECPPRDLAALTRRLTEISKDLEAIDLAEAQEAQRAGDTTDDSFDPSAL